MDETRFQPTSASRWRRLALTLSCAVFVACRQLPLHPIDPSPRAVLLTVPTVVQDELHDCGFASIAALCQYHGVEIPASERARLVALARERAGLSGAELRETLEGLGMEVFVFEGRLDHSVAGAFRHVDRERPLLVMISVDANRHHYCLLTGYDPERDNVFLLDPRRGNLVLPEASFRNLWAKSGRFTLLATPSGPTAERKPS